jgi:hypothetical protein
MSLLARMFRRSAKPAMGSPASNDAVRATLKSYGDDGTRARHVLHYAYPPGGDDLLDRPAMIQHLKRRGFEVKDAAVGEGLVLEHHRPVAADDFDAVTVELSAWFTERGWDYDGWECAVSGPED